MILKEDFLCKIIFGGKTTFSLFVRLKQKTGDLKRRGYRDVKRGNALMTSAFMGKLENYISHNGKW